MDWLSAPRVTPKPSDQFPHLRLTRWIARSGAQSGPIRKYIVPGSVQERSRLCRTSRPCRARGREVRPLPVNLEQAIIIEREITRMDTVILLLERTAGEGDRSKRIFAQHFAGRCPVMQCEPRHDPTARCPKQPRKLEGTCDVWEESHLETPQDWHRCGASGRRRHKAEVRSIETSSSEAARGSAKLSSSSTSVVAGRLMAGKDNSLILPGEVGKPSQTVPIAIRAGYGSNGIRPARAATISRTPTDGGKTLRCVESGMVSDLSCGVSGDQSERSRQRADREHLADALRRSTRRSRSSRLPRTGSSAWDPGPSS